MDQNEKVVQVSLFLKWAKSVEDCHKEFRAARSNPDDLKWAASMDDKTVKMISGTREYLDDLIQTMMETHLTK